MIDYLSSKLTDVFKKFKTYKKIDEKVLNEITQEIKKAFLESDVGYKITLDFIKNMRSDLLDKDLNKGESVKDRIFASFEKEMLAILGNKNYQLNISKKPTFIMIVGLQGSGKTTTIAKLANYYKNKLKKRMLIVSCDIHRPAAYEQLKKMADSIEVPVYYQRNIPLKQMIENCLNDINSKKEIYDIVLFDTAGRTAMNQELLNEIEFLATKIRPREVIINLDAMSGQSILNTVEVYQKYVKITAAVLTKFDSEAKSGAAFSITYWAEIPIVFVGTGEKITDLVPFYPERVVKRIMGHGDLLTLKEKASESFNEASTKSTIQKMLSGKFDLEDLIRQLEKMKKLGSFKGIIKMVPGMPKITNEQIEKAEKRLILIKIIANSTTIKERRNISLLSNPSRRNRIIKGSGVTIFQYNVLLKQIKQMKEKTKELRNSMQNKSFSNNF